MFPMRCRPRRPAAFDAGPDDFAGETDFVDPRALRAAAAQGRASSTRQAIDAARAAMASPEAAEAPARSGFGLKKGGKSKLQERLDKQATRGGSTVRKALGASAIAVLLTGGGAYATGQLTGSGLHIPGLTAAARGPAHRGPGRPAGRADARRSGARRRPVPAGDRTAGRGRAQRRRHAEAGRATGYTPAQLHLASLYQDGVKGVPVNLREARVWARRAADGGDAKGMHAYGMYLFEGVGGARDQGEALAWLKKAAERGLVDSQYNVAKLYETGDQAIQPDPAQAYKWYLIAARAGDGDAQAAVERLDKTIPAATRTQVRAEAEQFQVEPLA